MTDKVRLPKSSHRITNVGRTGSGKTHAGLWHLSNASLSTMPWMVFNFKGEKLIDEMPNVRDVDFDFVPKRKDTGLFILHPTPMDMKRPSQGEQSPLEKYLWQLWERENVGLFCDEGYMMGDNLAFAACLTQGRSKKIPMIVNAQRPAWLNRFVFSEADFFQVFHLNDKRDKQTIEGFVPLNYGDEDALGEYESWYFDVGKNKLWKFRPVPSLEEIYETIESKTERKKSWL